MVERRKPKQKLTYDPAQVAWYALSVGEAVGLLDSDPQAGLSPQVALERMGRFGPNTLPEERTDTYLDILIRQVRSPLVYVLFFAALVTLALRHFSDVIIILLTVAVNVVVGFIQERKANTSLAALKKAIKPTARVVREGKIAEINSADLVPGDLIIVRSGDRVPADARILEERGLEATEAELTGESVPSIKTSAQVPDSRPLAERDSMIYMGTSIASGNGRAMVVATGSATELGSVAKLLLATREGDTPLQVSLARFSRLLAAVTLALSFGLLLVGILQGRGFFEMLVTAVAVAVSAIPEGLLISMTVILALGMQRILRRRGLVRHMAATETLGSTSVICTDKTGTLTLGEMRISSLVTAFDEVHIRTHVREARHSEELINLLRLALLCNEGIVENPEDDPADWRIAGNITDKALLIAGAEAGLDRSRLEREEPLIGLAPFNEKNKYVAAIRRFASGGFRLYVKGAPEALISKTTAIDAHGRPGADGPAARDRLMKSFEAMTSRGLRVLGVAYRDLAETDLDPERIEQAVHDLVFAGFIGLQDPLRDEVFKTVNQARDAGIRSLIVTGDHRLTALAIARQAGIADDSGKALEGAEIDQLDDAQLSRRIAEVAVVARVTPAHKVRIVQALQTTGATVAMTGDGVNDAPALKAADIGISVGSGTEVARGASDLVLLDNNFRTIVAAVEEGRVIFNNIRRVILFLLFDIFQELTLIAGALVMGLPLPILPSQILWNNIVSNGLPNLALTVEPGEPDVMRRPPRPKSEPIVNRPMATTIVFVGSLVNALLFVIFLILLPAYPIEEVRTMILALFSLSTIFCSFALKNLRLPVWRIALLNNPWLLASNAIAIVMVMFSVYAAPLQSLLHTVSLPASVWLWLVPASFVKLAAIEVTKFFQRRQTSEPK